jgi:hypothetical protein
MLTMYSARFAFAFAFAFALPLALPATARADGIDAPPMKCTPGSTPQYTHGGPYCGAGRACSADAECGKSSACVESALCVTKTKVPSGRSHAMEERDEVVASCADGVACPSGAKCEVARRCVSASAKKGCGGCVLSGESEDGGGPLYAGGVFIAILFATWGRWRRRVQPLRGSSDDPCVTSKMSSEQA